jgi:hypothetical protein
VPSALQEREGSTARSDPSSAPSVKGYELPSGVTSSTSAVHSVWVVFDEAYTVAVIGPARVVAWLRGAVV